MSLALLVATAALTTPMRVLVSGAGGQTGQACFRQMLARPEDFAPLGLVRSEESKEALVSSGVPVECVVVADITDAAAVLAAASGCQAVVVCTSAKPAPTGETNQETGRPVFGFPLGEPEIVDWLGQKAQIDAAAAQGPDTHVVICSSMGGTDPAHMLNALGRRTETDGTTSGGDILLWKRKAERYAIDSKLPYTIVHPGGLLNEAGGVRELVVGVDDVVEGTDNRSVPREDVAAVLVAALLEPGYRFRSFDLVSKPEGDGAATADFAALVKSLGDRNCDYSLGRVAETAK